MFFVIDKKIGLTADVERIVNEEIWVRGLDCTNSVFAIKEDGSLIICDARGNCGYCPEDRFEIVGDINHPVGEIVFGGR